MKHKLTWAGIILVITGVFIACNIYSLIPLYPLISSEFGISARQVSYGSASFTLCYAFGLLFFGIIAERIGLKRIIVSGLLLSALTSILVSFSSDPITLIAFRGLQGFTLASFAPVSFNLCFHIYPDQRQRTFWIALINCGFLCAGIIGQLLSSQLATASWSAVYVFYCYLYLFLFSANLIILPRVETQHRTKESLTEIVHKMKNVLKNRTLLFLYGIVITLLFSFVGFYEGLSYYLADKEGDLLLIRSFGLLGVIPAIMTGTFIKKWGTTKLTRRGIFLVLASVFLLFYNANPLAIAFISIYFVAAISLLIPAVIEKIGREAGVLKGKALSLYSFILLIGASLGSLVAARFSYHHFLVILFILFLGNLLFNWNMKGRKMKKEH